MAGSTCLFASIQLSSIRLFPNGSPPSIVQKIPESGRYKFRKGYAMFVRIAGKALFIGPKEFGKMSKVSI
jgi:hypothetical protein